VPMAQNFVVCGGATAMGSRAPPAAAAARLATPLLTLVQLHLTVAGETICYGQGSGAAGSGHYIYNIHLSF